MDFTFVTLCGPHFWDTLDFVTLCGPHFWDTLDFFEDLAEVFLVALLQMEM